MAPTEEVCRAKRLVAEYGVPRLDSPVLPSLLWPLYLLQRHLEGRGFWPPGLC